MTTANASSTTAPRGQVSESHATDSVLSRSDPLSADRFHKRLRSDLEQGVGLPAETVRRWDMSHAMHRYRDDLLSDWLDWWTPEHTGSEVVGVERLGYPVKPDQVSTSRAIHQRVCRAVLNRPVDPERHDRLDRENAIDYYFQGMLGRPMRILDFGAGYGRNAFLWTANSERLAYVAVDAIEGPYLLQNRVLASLPQVEFREYCDGPESFSISEPNAGRCTVYHLPTWRLDLLPDGFFDLIICSQVLQELDGRFATELPRHFRRVIAPRGLLYIRDHEYYRPRHRVKFGRLLLADGWRLAFRYPGVDKHDIHGIPRIWRFTGEDTRALRHLPTILRRRLWLASPWTRFFRDTHRAKHGLLRKGVRHFLRKGRPRAGDLTDPFLPI